MRLRRDGGGMGPCLLEEIVLARVLIEDQVADVVEQRRGDELVRPLPELPLG